MTPKLFALAAVLSAACLSIPVAHADDLYVAVSVGLVNDAPPVSTVGGTAVNADQDTARVQSLSACQNAGGNHCVTEVIGHNQCAAGAANDYGEMTGGTGATRSAAGGAAMAALSNQTGAHVVASACTSPVVGQVPTNGIDQAPVVEQAPETSPGPPPPPPCQPQPWCERIGQIPQLPVMTQP
jgi:Domain of unknown function (DUF4189)